MNCPRCQQDNPPISTFCRHCGTPVKNPGAGGSPAASYAELARALSDAQEHEWATSEILRVITQSRADVQPVFDSILTNAKRLCEAQLGALFRYDRGSFTVVAIQGGRPRFVDFMRQGPILPSPGTGLGRMVMDRHPIHIADITTESVYVNRDPLRVATADYEGARSFLAVPMLKKEELVGAITVYRREVLPFNDKQIALLETFADQAVIAIENVRLFRELEAANRELEAASRHKSEFLANMSHELRTPLNAIIGFSEVLTEHMFGQLNDKQEEYLKDIHASGQHLLSLINDILDLSKIEAGRMELELTEFDLPLAIDNALTLVSERVTRHGIALHHEIDARLGQIRGDERKVKQVLLNLLSNAIKFTPEGGRIDVRAALVDEMAEVAVTDTGVGIAPEDQEAIFEEFRQVGRAAKKVEGTGLGLTLARRFVELHGGRIWVKSQVGVGSTFTFVVPVCGGR